MNLLALIGGDHIKGSLSPFIHNFWMQKYGIAGKYHVKPISNKYDINSELRKLVSNNHNCCYTGFNVTAPYKEVLISSLDFCDQEVFNIGAVNTVCIKNGLLYGRNTDHAGFIKGFYYKYPKFSFLRKNVLILGAGGSARAIIYGLIKESINTIYLYNRTLSKAISLSKNYDHMSSNTSFNIKIIELYDIAPCLQNCKIDVVINTIPYHFSYSDAILELKKYKSYIDIICDITYSTKIITPLLENFIEEQTVNGLYMLIWQAALAFLSWFNIEPKFIDELYNLLFIHCCYV